MLDTLIHRDLNGSLYTTVFRKPTHTDQYLAEDSHHPLQQKLGVLKTLFSRSGVVNTRPEDESRERRHLRDALSKCGYRDWQFRLAERPPTPAITDRPEYVGSVVLPYMRGTSESLRRVFEKAGVRTFFKPIGTLRQSLVSPKDPIELTERSGAVYYIPCQDCASSYIGESQRPLRERLAEHRRPSHVNSPVVTHTMNTGHNISWNHVKILDSDSNWFARGVRESIQINIHGSNLNRDKGRHHLPGVYTHLLKHHLDSSSRPRHLPRRSDQGDG